MKKLTQKRVCGNCKAFNQRDIKCNLLYTVDTGIRRYMKYGEPKPKEPCPKPLTNTEFIAELNSSRYLNKRNAN